MLDTTKEYDTKRRTKETQTHIENSERGDPYKVVVGLESDRLDKHRGDKVDVKKEKEKEKERDRYRFRLVPYDTDQNLREWIVRSTLTGYMVQQLPHDEIDRCSVYVE